MNKRITQYGTMVFDFVVIVFLLNLSFVLVIPFVAIIVGVVGYFVNEEDKQLRDIFMTIKTEINIIYKATIFYVLFIGISFANIYVIHTEFPVIDTAFNIISKVVIILMIVLLINTPIVINKMNVSLRQLLFNSFMIHFSNLRNSLTMIGFTFVYLYLGVSNILILFIGIYFVIYVIAKLSNINIIKLKEKKQ